MFSYFPMTTMPLPARPQTFRQQIPLMSSLNVGAPAVNMRASTVNMRASTVNMRASTVNMRASVLPSSMDCILSEDYGRGAVYLGDIDSAINYQNLLARNITAVLTVAAETNFSYTPFHGIDHMIIEAEDDPRFNLKQYFETAINFIENARLSGNVLIHCFAGISRSASVLIAYLMKIEGMDLNSAYRVVKERRWKVNPNHGFLGQLEQYEKEVRGWGGWGWVTAY